MGLIFRFDPLRRFLARIGWAAMGAVWVVPLVVSGCATANLTYLADGQPAYQVNCNLGLDGFNRCYRKAGEICGKRGFVLYDWQGRTLPVRNSDPSEINMAGWEAKSILVACNPR